MQAFKTNTIFRCAIAGMLLCALSAEMPAATDSQPGIRYLALGDSYTIGEGVEVHERWPTQLARRLEENGSKVSQIVFIARSGWTIADLADVLDQQDLDQPFDLVTLLIGANNEFRGGIAESIRAGIRRMIARAVGAAHDDASRVIVMSIPDWYVSPAAKLMGRSGGHAKIVRFNTVIREEAQRAGSAFVDITPVLQQVHDPAEWFAGDGLHPSARMYRRWVDSIFPVARRIVARRLPDNE